jgi:hypothetical protein
VRSSKAINTVEASDQRTDPVASVVVGLLIARELGQSYSLQQLAEMNGESLRSTMRRMLQKMARLRDG